MAGGTKIPIQYFNIELYSTHATDSQLQCMFTFSVCGTGNDLEQLLSGCAEAGTAGAWLFVAASAEWHNALERCIGPQQLGLM